MNSLGGQKNSTPKKSSPERAQSACPWTKTRRYGCPKPVELRRQAIDDIDAYQTWSKYGDNNTTVSRSRVFQDYGHIIDVPGPGEYTPHPELLSTEETLPKYSIGKRYPVLVFGERDALAGPSPKYISPGAVQINESTTFGYHTPMYPASESKGMGDGPSLMKYSPKHTVDSRYERFTAAVMPKRHRTVQPRKIIDLQSLRVVEEFGKHETMDPGMYHSDIFKKDPREKRIVISVGSRIKDPHPEGIDFTKPGPGYHEPDAGLFGDKPLGRGVAFPPTITQRRGNVVKSSYISPMHFGDGEVKKIKGTWVDATVRRENTRKATYSSVCSFDKKPPERRRATGKNMHSTVQNMQYHFKGRQSSGSMRFSHKK